MEMKKALMLVSLCKKAMPDGIRRTNPKANEILPKK
jgi:hypothetical protein